MDTPDKPDLRAIHGATYDEWFLRDVDKGITAADCGELLNHPDVRKLIDERYPG